MSSLLTIGLADMPGSGKLHHHLTPHTIKANDILNVISTLERVQMRLVKHFILFTMWL